MSTAGVVKPWRQKSSRLTNGHGGSMAKIQALTLASRDLLGRIGTQKTTREYRDKEEIYSQGDAAKAMFYVESGHVKLTVASKRGKRAVLAILGKGDFFGENCLLRNSRRTTTATALQHSTCRLREEVDPERHHSSGAVVFEPLRFRSAFSHRAHRRGFHGSTVELERKAPGATAVALEPFWRAVRD